MKWEESWESDRERREKRKGIGGKGEKERGKSLKREGGKVGGKEEKR
jgi:hypothetical protein